MLAKNEHDLTQGFDYSGLSSELVTRSIERKARIKANEEVATKAILDIAKDVKDQYDDLEDCEKWLDWCSKELSYKRSMAFSLKQIAEELVQRAGLKKLPSSYRALTQLASALTKVESEEGKEELLEAVEQETEAKGKALTEKEIKRIIQENDKAQNERIAQLEAYCDEHLSKLVKGSLKVSDLVGEFDLSEKIVVSVVEKKKKDFELAEVQKQLESEKRNTEWQSNIIKKMEAGESEQVKKLEEQITQKDSQGREAQRRIHLLDAQLMDFEEDQNALKEQIDELTDALAESMTTAAREELEIKEAQLKCQMKELELKETDVKRMLNEQRLMLIPLKESQSWVQCLEDFNGFFDEISDRLKVIAIKTTEFYPPQDLPKVREEFDKFVHNFRWFQELAMKVKTKIASAEEAMNNQAIDVEVTE
jgi:chromosome segregation ATPase